MHSSKFGDVIPPPWRHQIWILFSSLKNSTILKTWPFYVDYEDENNECFWKKRDGKISKVNISFVIRVVTSLI